MTPHVDKTLAPVGQDLIFQSRMWLVERVGWGAMLTVLLCASVGFFGHGPFSTAAIEQGSIRIEYERFGRYHGPMSLRFFLVPTFQKQGYATLRFSNEYLRRMEIVGTQPQPQRTDILPDGLRFIFTTEGEPTGGMITINVRPDTIGTIVGSVALNDNQLIIFHHFIYP